MEMYEQLSLIEDETVRDRELSNILEAVLFSFGRAVEVSELAKACDCDPGTVRKQLGRLMQRYEAEDRGLCIKELCGKYRMCTKSRYYPNLLNVLKIERKPVLTEVVMETLAIIAFKNPVTKAEIERIRGVKSDHAVNRLIEYGLVEETGRLNAPGRPALFAPTDEFYRRFDVSGKDGLPVPGPEIQAEIDEEVRAELKSFDEDTQKAETDGTEVGV